jgi:hypothetical protein
MIIEKSLQGLSECTGLNRDRRLNVFIVPNSVTHFHGFTNIMAVRFERDNHLLTKPKWINSLINANNCTNIHGFFNFRNRWNKTKASWGQVFRYTLSSFLNYIRNPLEKIFFYDLSFWILTFLFSGKIRDKLGFSGEQYNCHIREERDRRVKKFLSENDKSIVVDGMTFTLPDNQMGRADLFGILYDILPHNGILALNDRFFDYYSEGHTKGGTSSLKRETL